jgi:hypothetical protein
VSLLQDSSKYLLEAPLIKTLDFPPKNIDFYMLNVKAAICLSYPADKLPDQHPKIFVTLKFYDCFYAEKA